MTGLILDDEDGGLALLRDSASSFAARHDGAQAFRKRRSSGADLNREIWAGMAEAGWLGLLLPKDIGGIGLGLAEQAVLSESLGRALITEPLAQLSVFSSILLTELPRSDETARLAEGLIAGDAIVTPAWQGRDGSSAPVTIHSAGDELRLNGKLEFVSAAQSGTDFLVLGHDGNAGVWLSIPADTVGLTINAHETLDGSRIFSVELTDVMLPADQVLARGDKAEYALERAICVTRLMLAAEMAGNASRAIEITINYTKERVQFGRPIAAFQVVQHRLVDMWGDAEFANAAVVNAIETFSEQGGVAADLAVLAAKARAGDVVLSVTRRAIHLHGAMGFTDEADIGLYMKRAVALSATLGQPEVLRLQFVVLERATA